MNEIDRDKLKEIFDKAIELVDEVGFQLSKSEVGHIDKSLKIKSIKTPKLLIKIIKIQTQTENFPTRM